MQKPTLQPPPKLNLLPPPASLRAPGSSAPTLPPRRNSGSSLNTLVDTPTPHTEDTRLKRSATVSAIPRPPPGPPPGSPTLPPRGNPPGTPPSHKRTVSELSNESRLLINPVPPARRSMSPSHFLQIEDYQEQDNAAPPQTRPPPGPPPGSVRPPPGPPPSGPPPCQPPIEARAPPGPPPSAKPPGTPPQAKSPPQPPEARPPPQPPRSSDARPTPPTETRSLEARPPPQPPSDARPPSHPPSEVRPQLPFDARPPPSPPPTTKARPPAGPPSAGPPPGPPPSAKPPELPRSISEPRVDSHIPPGPPPASARPPPGPPPETKSTSSPSLHPRGQPVTTTKPAQSTFSPAKPATNTSSPTTKPKAQLTRSVTASAILNTERASHVPHLTPAPTIKLPPALLVPQQSPSLRPNEQSPRAFESSPRNLDCSPKKEQTTPPTPPATSPPLSAHLSLHEQLADSVPDSPNNDDQTISPSETVAVPEGSTLFSSEQERALYDPNVVPMNAILMKAPPIFELPPPVEEGPIPDELPPPVEDGPPPVELPPPVDAFPPPVEAPPPVDGAVPGSGLFSVELGPWAQSITDLAALSKNLKKRKQVAGEILSTEETYVIQLNCLITRFVDQLKQVPRGLSIDDKFKIFSNVAVIRDCHERLLESISERLAVWDENSLLGDIFKNETAWIKLYKHYVNNYGTSLITLKECKEKFPLFKKYLEHLDYSSSLFGLNLEGLLITPVQRIPRYMLKATPTAHPDFAPLTDALKFIKELADFINDNKHDAEAVEQLCAVQVKLIGFSGSLAALPKRRFVKEGTASWNKKKKYLFLFNDTLIVSKPKDSKYVFETIHTLQTCTMQPEQDPLAIVLLSPEGKFKLQFQTPKDAEEWRAAITTTLDGARQQMIASVFQDSIAASSEGSKSYEGILDAENEKKSLAAVKGLLESEQEYVKVLQSTSAIFIQQMKKTCDGPQLIIERSSFNRLYTIWDNFVKLHSKFMEDLTPVVANWNGNSHIVDIMDADKFISLYKEYVGHHAEQLQALETAKNSQAFLLWLLDVEAQGKVELKALLERPLRRISEYYLELMHCSNKKQAHYEPLRLIVTKLSQATEELKRKLTGEQIAAASTNPKDRKRRVNTLR